jgi:hypothetical protein
MKTARFTIIILAALLALGVSTTAYAFHAGGVAECGGCHSMHNANDNMVSINALLIGTDQSSTCLTCHEKSTDTGPSSYHVSSASSQAIPLQRTPGGDFGWLRKGYGTADSAESHGHNIVAFDYQYSAEGTANSPGGTFPADKLGCNSCHDPHGKYRRAGDETVAISTTGAPIIASGSYAVTTAIIGGGSPTGQAVDPPPAGLALGVYRLLAGSGYQTKGPNGGAFFQPGFSGVPMAKAPNSYNRSETSFETRVAYGVKEDTGNGKVNWGTWCKTCHTDMHSNSGTYVHPVDSQLINGKATIYKEYVSSGITNPGSLNGFTSLVPFSTNAGATYVGLAALATNNFAYNAGPGPSESDHVMCLSCHRAHASAFPEALRWFMEGTFVTNDNNYALSTRTSSKGVAEFKAGYYDRNPGTIGKWQRVLCNKCHMQD